MVPTHNLRNNGIVKNIKLLHKIKCHTKEFVNIYYINLHKITFILVYKNPTYQFDYQKPKIPSYPRAYYIVSLSDW